jgi:hypothetical protein
VEKFVPNDIGPSLFFSLSCLATQSNTNNLHLSAYLDIVPHLLQLYFSQFLELIVELVF